MSTLTAATPSLEPPSATGIGMAGLIPAVACGFARLLVSQAPAARLGRAAVLVRGSTAEASPEPPAGAPTDGLAEDSPDGPLHPASRQAARLAPPSHAATLAAPPPAAGAAPPSGVTSPPSRISLEELLPELVRRAAWSGDGRRGALRLEFGAGALAGATLLVQADEGRVRVRLTVPPGTDADGWRSRISARLEGKGLDVDSVEVD